MIIKAKEYPVAPEGEHEAECVDIKDLGIVQTPFGRKEQLRIEWQLKALDNEGKPYKVRQTYSKSLSEKAKLRQHIEGWLGRELTRTEAREFDLDLLKSIPCLVEIVHNIGTSGATYANVEAISECAVPF